MSSDDSSQSRRDFLHKSVKALTAASLPVLMGADSCHKQEECDPQISNDTGKQTRNSDKPEGSYDVLVIGSGFGATVAVSKLLTQQPKLKLLILERGLWWLSPDRPVPSYLKGLPPGDRKNLIQYFTRPDHSQGARYLLSILKTNKINLPSRNSPLYYIHSFPEIDVMTAGGVGGGSLIYLNVTIPPIIEDDGSYSVLRDWPLRLVKGDYDNAIEWMTKWRGKLNHIVTEFPTPGLDVSNLGDKDYLYLSKTRAYRSASSVSGEAWKQRTSWTPAPLSVTDYYDTNTQTDPEFNDLEICTRQGRCFLGCLPGAIQTLDKTLLKTFLGQREKYPFLELHALKEVNHISVAREGGYHVWFRDRVPGANNKLKFYHAKQVVLAAGTLGSTEILLRSHCSEKTLQLSPTLGHRFSGNGDLGGFIRGVGSRGKIPYKVYPTRGPLITSLTQFETKDAHPRYGNIQMTVEDGGIPPTLSNFTRLLLEFIEGRLGDRPPGARIDGLGEYATKLSENAFKGDLNSLTSIFSQRTPEPGDPKNFRTEQELLENTFYFQCMGKDEPNGEFYLNGKGKLDLRFSEPPLDHPVYTYLEEIMRKIADNMGGRFLKFPTLYLPKRKLFTLHPLGGCSMGNDSDHGVVDVQGRVFKRSANSTNLNEVYEGLYVMDASIFPGPVAANPTLTIVALALRIADGIRV